ncbi:MAG TPA: hypothetical protein VMT34_10230, partial [Aggregatilineales bacterium]|nr:hypothetical protein [Aggregatilineales bacterium]
RFNRAVRAEKRFYSAMDSTYPLDDGDWYFTLDLPDRVIIDYDVTASILPAPLPGTILERAWISTETMGGWHVAAGLPRRPQLAAHGVILYRAPADLSRAEIEHALAVVEEAGIGQERGYGFVRVCDPFHLVVAPV